VSFCQQSIAVIPIKLSAAEKFNIQSPVMEEREREIDHEAENVSEILNPNGFKNGMVNKDFTKTIDKST
jgi:hypothetical protein